MPSVPWWTSDWDELCRAAPVTDEGRLGRVGRGVTDSEIDAAGGVQAVLGLWPRLTHDQRARVQVALSADEAPEPVPGVLLACFAAEAPDAEYAMTYPDDRDELNALVGLPVELDGLQRLAGNPAWVAGPLAYTVVGQRTVAAFAGTVGRELRQHVLDTAVLSPHLTYAEARTLMTSDPRRVLGRADAPFDEVTESYVDDSAPFGLSWDAADDWRVAKHPDCPEQVVATNVSRTSYRDALDAVSTPVSDAYVAALLRHRRQIFRQLVASRLPDQVVRAMRDRFPEPTWKHLASDCPPRHRAYLEAYTTHPAVQVRTAYVRAWPDHPVVAQRALSDTSRHVRAALLGHTRNADHVAALAADPSPAIRRDAVDRVMAALRREQAV
jgi:hypothetical protein